MIILPSAYGAAKGESGLTYPLDGLTTPMVAWSLARKLRGAYNGYAFKVRNASDVDLDIGFDATTGEVDMTAFNNHVGGGVQATIRTVYDQSGNGRDLNYVTTPNYEVYCRESSANITIGTNSKLSSKRGQYNSYGQLKTSASWSWDSGTTAKRWSVLMVVAAGASSFMEFRSGTYYMYLSGDYAFYYDGTTRSIALGGTRSSSGVGFMARGANNDWDASWNGGAYTDGSCATGGQDASATKYISMNDPLARFTELVQWDVDMAANRSTLVSNARNFYGL